MRQNKHSKCFYPYFTLKTRSLQPEKTQRTTANSKHTTLRAQPFSRTYCCWRCVRNVPVSNLDTLRENWSILSRYQSFTKKLTVKLGFTSFRKNWPNFEHYARVIFIHEFCAFYMTPRIYENIAMICVRNEAQVLPLTFGLKLARYC